MAYRQRWLEYHRRYLALYLLTGGAISLFYRLHWPTPLSLLLAPFGLQSWSVGMTRATVRLLHGDVAGAWGYNPLIFLVLVLAMVHLFCAPLLDNRKDTQ